MIVWLLALVLLALVGWAGYHQGAIRAGISFLGIVFGAILAMPLSPLVRPLVALAVQHPILQKVLPPVVVFLVVLIAFKIGASIAHRKMEFIYRYKKGEGFWRWERLNQQLGLCVGLLNGAFYFFLLMIPIYVFGYLTTQLASGAGDPPAMRYINQTREQLHAARFDKVVAGYDPSPKEFYDASDIIALIYHNPLLQSRLSRYPSLLMISEKPEFQALANDIEVNTLLQRQATVAEILEHPRVQNIITNAQLTAEISDVLKSDLKDLKEFLKTGKSEKYGDERILGRWDHNIASTFNLEREKRSMSGQELRVLRNRMAPYYRATLIATPDNRILINTAPDASTGMTKVLAEGSWKEETGAYLITFQGGTEPATAYFEEGNLLLPKEGMTLVFEPQIDY